MEGMEIVTAFEMIKDWEGLGAHGEPARRSMALESRKSFEDGNEKQSAPSLCSSAKHAAAPAAKTSWW